ncbi:MAG: hypothetical protein AB1529_06660 [Candidatus Micrarchaeota archaeon]
MDKKQLLLIGSGLIVLLLVMEPFFFGGGGTRTGPSIQPGRNYTGTTIFNGSIRTYDPYLYLPVDTDQSVISQLRLLEAVSDVRAEQNSYVVQVRTRDDVFPTAAWLMERNVTSYSIANVAVNQGLEVNTSSGFINATVPGGVIRVVAEPLLDAGHEVTVSMVAVVSSGLLIDYSSASLLLQEEQFVMNATVESLEQKIYTYSVPWEERNSLGDLSRLGEASYKKVDSMVFPTPLDISQIMAKKQFSYIIYIDASSAQVEPSFDNLTMLQENFGDTLFMLPDSTLVVRTNGTPDLPYAPDSVFYSYRLRLQDPPYDFGQDTLAYESSVGREINSTVELNVTALVLGDKVLSIKRVSLPS